MRKALLILRKDARQQRWPLASFLLLLVMRMAIDIVLPRHAELILTQTILGIVFPIEAAGLIHAAVHQERIVGETQYWLTRPLPWRSILAAKALFIVVFIMLPFLITVTIPLLLNGVSPLTAFPMLLFLALAGLFIIAVASVTRTQVQLVLTVVAYLTLLLLSLMPIQQLFGYETGDWGSAQSVRTNADLSLFGAILAVMVVRQYRRRSIASARILLAAAMLVTLIGLPGWHIAFALVERLDGPGNSAGVRVDFDHGPPQRRPGKWSYFPGEDVVGVKVPVAITGIPAGAKLMGERVRTTIDAPGGRHWDSGWRFLGGIMGDTNPGAGPHEIPSSNSPYWLAVNVDRSFFESARLKEVPVRVRATAAFALVSAAAIVRLPVPSVAHRIGPGEFCSVTVNAGALTIPCVAASGDDIAAFSFRVRQGEQTDQAVRSWSIAPFSAWMDYSNVSIAPNFVPAEVEVETRHNAGVFERTMTLDAIVLGPFEVGRSTARRDLFEGVRNVAWE